MDPVTGAAVIAGLKYVGKPSAELVLDFVRRLVMPTGDAVGKVVADPIAQWGEARALRTTKMLSASAVILAEAGVEPQAVPPYLLLPLLEKGSLIDDNELSLVWAQLLASAATGSNELVFPAFPQILSELTPLEARVLSLAYQRIKSRHKTSTRNDVNTAAIFQELNISNKHQRALVVDNLIRLRLVGQPVSLNASDFRRIMRTQNVPKRPKEILLDDGRRDIFLTALGITFIEACAGPLPKPIPGVDQPTS